MRGGTLALALKFGIALPYLSAQVRIGTPYLGTEKRIALFADDFGRENTFSAVFCGEGMSTRIFYLYAFPFCGRNNCFVTVFYIVFRAFAVVDSDLFADAVGDVGLIDDGIALVSLVGENGLYRGKLPLCFSRRAFDALFFK